MEITPGGLASLTGGIIEGDADVKITGFAKIEEAREGDLTFLANPKYSHFVDSTKATAILVRKDFENPGRNDITFIRVDDPYAAIALLLNLIQSQKERPTGIEQPVYMPADLKLPEDIYLGAFTYIGKGVELGKNVKIYPQCYIGDNVKIGDNTVLYAGVKIYYDCEIGKDCVVHSGAVIGADGFGFAPVDGHYEKIPQTGNVIIKDRVEIGANTTIDRATFGSTIVEEGTKLDNLIQIAHNVKIGKDNVFAAQTGIAGSTAIGDSNRIGGQCGFAGHLKVGNNNEIGAQSGVHSNIGDNKRMIGYPAVDFLQFAKTQAYLKKLPQLFLDLKN